MGLDASNFLRAQKTETRKALYHIRPSVAGAKRNLAELLPPGRGDGALELHSWAGAGRIVWIPAADASRMLPLP